MRFRPCIDLRNGRVVQIVGGSLRETAVSGIATTPKAGALEAAGQEAIVNFETEQSSADFARMYRNDGLLGGHVISLGQGNRGAALTALAAFPGGMQVGGGITAENAREYLEAGASHVIVTSYVFREGVLDQARLDALVAAVGTSRLVLDLSCRRRGEEFRVVTDRWQRFTEVTIAPETLSSLAAYCDEFLIHGVDVEGKRMGVDEQLVRMLGEWSPIPVTYAGGAKRLEDLDEVRAAGDGRVDLSIGSALDIFGGSIPYQQVVAWQRAEETRTE